jgi:hypothetical protein
MLRKRKRIAQRKFKLALAGSLQIDALSAF